jgi:hypothetical protein
VTELLFVTSAEPPVPLHLLTLALEPGAWLYTLRVLLKSRGTSVLALANTRAFWFWWGLQVKNKSAASVQITAEQIIREAQERQLEVVKMVSCRLPTASPHLQLVAFRLCAAPLQT